MAARKLSMYITVLVCCISAVCHVRLDPLSLASRWLSFCWRNCGRPGLKAKTSRPRHVMIDEEKLFLLRAMGNLEYLEYHSG